MFILLQTIFGFGPTAIDIDIMLFLVIYGIMAMGCYMSLVKELHDNGKIYYSYSWCFGIAWASVAVALVGSIISTIGLFKSLKETKNSLTSLERLMLQ